MNRYRVMLRWEMTANVFVDAENEQEARDRAGDAEAMGDEITGSLVIDDVEDCGPVDDEGVGIEEWGTGG